MDDELHCLYLLSPPRIDWFPKWEVLRYVNIPGMLNLPAQTPFCFSVRPGWMAGLEVTYCPMFIMDSSLQRKSWRRSSWT
jgi:hypothetical protein